MPQLAALWVVGPPIDRTAIELTAELYQDWTELAELLAHHGRCYDTVTIAVRVIQRARPEVTVPWLTL